MHLTAYDTIACRAYNQEGIKRAIELALIEDELFQLKTPDTGKEVKGVWGVSTLNEDIPAFSHPFRAELEGNPFYFVDTRAYIQVERDGSKRYTNVADYRFQIIRAVLNQHWEEEPRDLINTGELGPLIFCRWLSEAISRRLGLGPTEQARIMTVTLFFWHSLFRRPEDAFDEKEKMRILTKLNQISSIPTTLSMEIVDDIEVMPGLEVYVDTLKRVVGSARLESLNPALLFAMLGGSWFGLNAKETIAVATEHPPTFLAIVLSALESRSYRKSVLGRLVYDNDKRDRGKTFSRSVYQIIQQYVGD
tara:strand:- start:10628 stop:11545 length:918 start_codon:yes stop_codon:yes gene_type:complete